MLFGQTAAFAAPEPTEYRLVEVDPYGQLERFAELPGEDAATAHVKLARNEYEAVCLAIGNDQPEATTFTARVLLEKPKGAQALPAELVSLRQVVFVNARSRAPNTWVIKLPYKVRGGATEVADPLVPLDPASLITVPAGETAYLWVTIHSGDLKAGEYHLNLAVRPLYRRKPKTVAIKVTVWPFALPDKTPLDVFVWDSNLNANESGKVGQAYREMLTSHRVNAFHIRQMPRPPCDAKGNVGEVDFAKRLDRLLDLEQGHGTWVIEIHYWSCGRPLLAQDNHTRFPFMSEVFRNATRVYIQGLVAYLKQRGIDYDQWSLYPCDESLNPDFRKFAQFVKQIDPQVRIWTDSAGKSLEGVTAFAPYVDIWCPLYKTAERHPDRWAVMKSTGKPIWNYFCGRYMKKAPPVYYRQTSWLAWRDGLQGVTFWTAVTAFGDQWDDFDYPDDKGDPATLYPLHDGVASSRRFEAFRDGLEDYCYFQVLAGLAKPDEKQRVATHISAAVDELLATCRTPTTQRWRLELAQQIIAHGEIPPQ